MGLADWVAATTGGASIRTIARRMDRSPDTVSRWIRQGRMPTEALLQFSRIYRADLLEGVLVGGLATREDVERTMPQLLRFASSVQLTAELHRRASGRTSRTVAS